ncbi:hypothetical protein EV421DRAFT_179143 [Armillaria borealis]|uniref:MYND-type domain-containing protein n=1 Tax=Armillaria borealis TaxID=47425 RepID=A0AA39MV73_9AGAR|nr:hypothetical protein EV421DRAFT_179143 [Armillaria borealis]
MSSPRPSQLPRKFEDMPPFSPACRHLPTPFDTASLGSIVALAKKHLSVPLPNSPRNISSPSSPKFKAIGFLRRLGMLQCNNSAGFPVDTIVALSPYVHKWAIYLLKTHLRPSDVEANLDIIVFSLHQISHFARYPASNALLPSLSPEVVPYMLELYVDLLKVSKLTSSIVPTIQSYLGDCTVGGQCRRIFESVPHHRLLACIKPVEDAGSTTSLQTDSDDLHAALTLMYMHSAFDPKIRDEFLKKNAIKWICKALQHITPNDSRNLTPGRLQLPSIAFCMTYLYSILSADISLAVRPIRHGQLLRSLLRSIIVVAQEPSPVDRPEYGSIITVMDMIGDCCMWWPALRAAVTALKSLRKEETQILPKHAKLRASWLQMVQKVENRSQLRDSMRYVPYCQNPQCTVVGSKALKRCTACLNMSVCSPECQEREWKNGHREKCRYLRVSPCPTMRAEDEDFLRYLIMQDILKHEQLMMPKTLEFLTKTDPSVLCLDYRAKPLFVSLMPIAQCPMVGQELIDKRNLNKDTSIILQLGLPLALDGITVTQVVENFDFSTIRVV